MECEVFLLVVQLLELSSDMPSAMTFSICQRKRNQPTNLRAAETTVTVCSWGGQR